MFRRIALGLDGAFESEHMGHPDFRAHGRIFATLRGDGKHGMVALTPEQQRRYLNEHPDAFTPASGAWGRSGSTMVTLAAADAEIVGEAMTLAWQNAAARLKPRAPARLNTRAPKRIAAAKKTKRRRSS